MSDLCKFCNLPITAKYRKWKACEPCGRKAKNAYQNARRAAERRCKAEGCASKVATPYARYCAEHAPEAKRENSHRTKLMLMPVVGRKAKHERLAAELREEIKPVAVYVPPTVRTTRLPGVPSSFREYLGNAEERPYQRRSRSGAAW